MLPKGTFPDKVFLNGKLLESNEATISVFDRGFLFGDGIYEVMVQLEHGIFYKDAHLIRLRKNLKQIGIRYDVGDMDKQLEPLLRSSGLQNKPCLIYMQVTRGVAPRKHAYPKNIPPTVMMYAIPYSLPHINEKSMQVILLPDSRWHRCDIKSISLLGNVMANETAIHQHAHEAVLVREGFVTEGSHTNIFFVKDGVVLTHPANEYILDGITRKIVLKICRDLNIPIYETAVKKEDISFMDEAFLTGTTTQVASIAKLGNNVFHTSRIPGEITKKIQEVFAQLKESDSAKLVL